LFSHPTRLCGENAKDDRRCLAMTRVFDPASRDLACLLQTGIKASLGFGQGPVGCSRIAGRSTLPLHRINLAAKTVAAVDVVAELHDTVGRRPGRDID